jgi:hypothetical protein
MRLIRRISWATWAHSRAVFARSSSAGIGWNLWGFLPHFLPSGPLHPSAGAPRHGRARKAGRQSDGAGRQGRSRTRSRPPPPTTFVCSAWSPTRSTGRAKSRNRSATATGRSLSGNDRVQVARTWQPPRFVVGHRPYSVHPGPSSAQRSRLEAGQHPQTPTRFGSSATRPESSSARNLQLRSKKAHHNGWAFSTSPCSQGPVHWPQGRCHDQGHDTWRQGRSAPCCCCRDRSPDRRGPASPGWSEPRR